MIRRIDAHHHLWDEATGCHPLLSGPPVDRFWGNSGELRKRYDVLDFLRDARDQNVVASVYVEAAYVPAAGEAAAIQAIADEHCFPQAFLTRIDLAAADAADRIASDAACSNWRGVRISAPWPSDPAALQAQMPLPFEDPAWRCGVSALWSAESIRPLVRRLLDLFGSDRLIIGTNAPVDLVMAPYATIVARFDQAIADLPERDRTALWYGTAARLYRIGA